MRVSILLVCMTALMGCTRIVDTAGSAISASDLADLKSHVDAIERRDHHRLRAIFSTITLPGEPRTLAVRPLVTPFADGLIRASAIECAPDLGTPVTLSATGATARVRSFLGQRDSRSDPNANLVPSRSFDLACPELG